ncbi:UDP-N-acetylmuramate dehydrogenase [Priestia flexa]|jgi:UDP-N-acetylmuramate dehydrogenase|uniref:UDP-N-acetylenolpyruvoylglucosamine reductase n=2 Tax=Priestia TaxID=2800373 RepID=A0A0V8JRQ0_9BACI|nr:MULTISPECIES: UDP-N-acetylmuramate dehydrogenase [Bacillaceae]AQX53960.1 UDP-N-acetylenolpyruvoylglucosamine reductase [Priestia flexa]KSU89747.1 UDP-N-acetylenolpyruvoylglucosamine reductase [Priestia veravalensis]KZB92510.1 UDP-N-acetylenolpyruvoylglucosamine reductase [Bacillus sp. VT 712]MBN8250174.1 UDP-N-acetylmuramate dehydrogenase [Priestia flexa]MBN8433004.1 UDP-N-acetylmuramate dehydrogenase [Priestia flexa]
MEALVKELMELNIGRVRENEPLSKHTTMKIGGPADVLLEPSSVENLKIAMDIIRKHNVKWRAIGRGSNLLVSDKGIEGVVIKLGAGLDDLQIDGERVTVGGGYPSIKLATVITKQGLSGLEFSSGIPGSVGGAVYMNAGAHGSDMSQILEKAYILFEDGTLEWLSNKEMKFSYRNSILQKERPGVCVQAVLQLKKGTRDEIVGVMQKNKDYRRETQPWNFPCAGSIFRNPLPNYAGDLIEKSGLKGYSIGGAQISEMHGNFIVNTGNGTASDVLALIDHVKKTIKERFDIDMHTEVEIIGR